MNQKIKILNYSNSYFRIFGYVVLLSIICLASVSFAFDLLVKFHILYSEKVVGFKHFSRNFNISITSCALFFNTLFLAFLSISNSLQKINNVSFRKFLFIFNIIILLYLMYLFLIE